MIRSDGSVCLRGNASEEMFDLEILEAAGLGIVGNHNLLKVMEDNDGAEEVPHVLHRVVDDARGDGGSGSDSDNGSGNDESATSGESSSPEGCALSAAAADGSCNDGRVRKKFHFLGLSMLRLKSRSSRSVRNIFLSTYRREKVDEAPVAEQTHVNNFFKVASSAHGNGNSPSHAVTDSDELNQPPSRLLEDLLRIGNEKDELLSGIMADAVEKDKRIVDLENQVSELKGELAAKATAEAESSELAAARNIRPPNNHEEDLRRKREIDESFRKLKDRTKEIEKKWAKPKQRESKTNSIGVNDRNSIEVNKNTGVLWSEEGIDWGGGLGDDEVESPPQGRGIRRRNKILRKRKIDGFLAKFF